MQFNLEDAFAYAIAYLHLKAPSEYISFLAELWFQPILQLRLMLWTYGNAHAVVQGVLCHNCREGEE